MRSALLACALICAATAAQAQDSPFSYTYAEARYTSVDADALNANGKGGSIAGSFGFAENFFVAGNGGYFKSDDFSVGTARGSVEAESATLGLGAHYGLTPTLDVLASASYLYVNADGKGGFSGNSSSDSGFQLETGLRIQVLEQLEMRGIYDYARISDDDASSFTIEAEYKFTPNISAVTSLVRSTGQDGYTVGGRYNF